MTMMSRNSSDSSLDEQESTVSSKSGPRKSLGSLISQNRRTRDRDSPSDSSDMPSLSSFRLDEMSASVASRGDSYVSRGDCDISLPSLSSFRMEEMSLASSYHSGTNHLSEESAEGWSSFTSGNVSADTDSDEEFATSSSAPESERGEAGEKHSPAPKSGILKAGAPVDSIPDGTNNCNLTSNARPPRRRSPAEEEMKDSLLMRRPRRTLSPMSNSRGDASEQAPTPAKDDEIPRPPRSSSPDRTPVERTESLPLSVLQRPARPAQGDSSSSVRTPGDSSSSLRGGDSLPRLPRRTSTLDDRSTHAEEEGDDDTKVSAEGSHVSDEDTKISYDDVTEVSDGDVSIDSDLSDDDSVSRTKPLHQSDNPAREEGGNSHPEGIIDFADSMKDDAAKVRPSDGSDVHENEATARRTAETHEIDEQDEIHACTETPTASHAEDEATSERIREPVANAPPQEDSAPADESASGTGLGDQAAASAPQNDQPEREEEHPETTESKTGSDQGKAAESQSEPSEEKDSSSEPAKGTDPSASGNTNGKDGKGPVRNRKSPTSVREIEGTLPAKESDEKAPDESGATSAEESGTTASDTEAEESEVIDKRNDKKDDSKRGRLLRKMSNSFRNLGRSTSFRNSFRMIGRTASKIKLMGRREDGQKKEGQRSSHESVDSGS